MTMTKEQILELDPNGYYFALLSLESIAKQTAIVVRQRTDTQTHDWHEFFAHNLLTIICSRLQSVLRLSQGSSCWKENEAGNNLDFAGICTLARTFVDTYLVLRQACIEGSNSPSMSNFWELYDKYYRITTEHKIASSFDQNEVNTSSLANNLEELETKIKEHESYISLTKEERRRVLNPVSYLLFDKMGSLKNAGIPTKQYSRVHTYLSKMTHSDSYCVNEVVHITNDSENAHLIFGEALRIVNVYSCLFMRDFCRHFHPITTASHPLIDQIDRWTNFEIFPDEEQQS